MPVVISDNSNPKKRFDTVRVFANSATARRYASQFADFRQFDCPLPEGLDRAYLVYIQSATGLKSLTPVFVGLFTSHAEATSAGQIRKAQLQKAAPFLHFLPKHLRYRLVVKSLPIE